MHPTSSILWAYWNHYVLTAYLILFFTSTLFFQALNMFEIYGIIFCHCPSCWPCLLCFDAWCWPPGVVQDSLGSEKREALLKTKISRIILTTRCCAKGSFGTWLVSPDHRFHNGAIERYCMILSEVHLAMLGRPLLPVPHNWKSWWSTPMWHCQRTVSSLARITNRICFVSSCFYGLSWGI